MKYYVQFLNVKLNGKIDEALGSDGVFILDGRNKLDTMICDAQERMHRLRFVQKSYVGYRIMKGSFNRNPRMIYQWIRSGVTAEVENEHIK